MFNRFEDNMDAMTNKSKLQGQECFIDNDLTTEERKIQAELRQKAREERDKGKPVQVGYHKIRIDGQWVNWKDLDSKNNP